MSPLYEKLKNSLLDRGVGVVRTDTLYGLVALMRNKEAVEKVYVLKGRTVTKPCIILVAHQSDIPFDQEKLSRVYAEAQGMSTTVVVPVSDQPDWLTRGGNSLAYRVPEKRELRELIEEIGPIIAPSANPEGLAPARDIDEARAYFGNQVDCYVDEGRVPDDIQASQIIRLSEDGIEERLR